MSKLSTLTSRGRFLGAAAALLLTTAVSALAPTLAGAEQISERSLSLSSSAPGTVTTGTPGSATNGAAARYTFSFKAGSAHTLGAMSFMVCDTAFGYIDVSGDPLALNAPCANPGGFTAAASTLNGTTGVTGVTGSAGWTKVASANPNVIQIQAATPGTVTAGAVIVVVLEGVTNPTDDTYTGNAFQNTFFANIATYASSAFTTRIDEGTVASAVTQSIGITARVQETLKFSVGTENTAPSVVCEALGNVDAAPSPTLTLGDATNQALSPTQVYTADSYVRLSTNSAFGTEVQYTGKTLSSGTTNTITPVAAPTAINAGSQGTEQFGLNVQDVTTQGATVELAANTDYADPALYKFTDTEVIANTAVYHQPQLLASSLGFVTCDTAAVQYAANISNDTEAGIYRTSVNYIAVPKY